MVILLETVNLLPELFEVQFDIPITPSNLRAPVLWTVIKGLVCAGQLPVREVAHKAINRLIWERLHQPDTITVQ
jgi:hypothetical protein